MIKPTTLYSCVSRHDACYLKNAIQRTSVIPVEIVKENDLLHLVTSESNYYKAKIIIATQQKYLPSVLSKKNKLTRLSGMMKEENGGDFIFRSNLGKMLQKLDLVIKKNKYYDLLN
ncbi:hypothetical protein [Wenyingzhuangia sp. IMCC45574]